jgi:anti-sigma regulatory factor (Ser/Thr protein kinase)
LVRSETGTFERVYSPVAAEYQGLPPQLQSHTIVSSTVIIDIPRDRSAPGHARRAIEDLNGRIAPDVVPDVKLLVSELITNSVKYGGNGAVSLRVETDTPRKMRIEVIDQGAGFVPVARDRPKTEVGGWGLHLVQTLSDRWGVYEGSTHVWFEIDRTGDA